jgi:hypothetical protein
MCNECYNAVTYFYPYLSDEDKYNVLIGATCFPFGNPQQVANQLFDLVENTDGSVTGALAYADKLLSDEWKKVRPLEMVSSRAQDAENWDVQDIHGE